jgi:hypothetical protein
MTDETKPESSASHDGFERRDIGVAGVLYFLLGLAFAGLIIHFVVTGLFSYLDKQTEAQQTPVSPLVTNAPADTRHIPKQYTGDYEKYLKENFPSPQLEINERNQLDKVRLAEEQTLSTYGYVDQKAGTVRIPIERAMDLIAERGLPVRAQAAETTMTAKTTAKSKPKETSQ